MISPPCAHPRQDFHGIPLPCAECEGAETWTLRIQNDKLAEVGRRTVDFRLSVKEWRLVRPRRWEEAIPATDEEVREAIELLRNIRR